MTDPLEVFPDGGRANTVRRFSPPLTHREFCLLLTCQYESPGRFSVGNPDRTRALKLVKAGLLERNPTGPDMFRQTRIGQDVMRRWRELGWSP